MIIEKKGRIHSIESFGTVDGPGIRMVVFMQGCSLRCKYCHNPDTWMTNCGKLVTTDEILSEYSKYNSYMDGLTISGGEALLQHEFIFELFKKSKSMNINTCLDTSGITFRKNNIENIKKMKSLMNYTDLVLLDLKHIDEKEHRILTGHTNKNILDFAVWLNEIKQKIWIRHVLVPNITLKKEYLEKLARFIAPFTNIEKIELLPYHKMGIPKWEKLGWKYSLIDIEPPSNDEYEYAKNIFLKSYIKNKKEVLNDERLY